MKTLGNFLRKHRASELFDFAKKLTLKEFLDTCHSGDLILWLFKKTNPESKREICLAAGHCVSLARELITKYFRSFEDVLSLLDAIIAFGEGRITRDELRIAKDIVMLGRSSSSLRVLQSVLACEVVLFCAEADSDDSEVAAYAAYHTAIALAETNPREYYILLKKNHKATADICRKYLPLKIWNQSEI